MPHRVLCPVCQHPDCRELSHGQVHKPMERLDEIAWLMFIVLMGVAVVVLLMLIAL